jgi:hypothetical protein
VSAVAVRQLSSEVGLVPVRIGLACGWLVDCCWLVGKLVSWFTGQLIDWLLAASFIDLLINFIPYPNNRQKFRGISAGCLADSFIVSLINIIPTPNCKQKIRKISARCLVNDALPWIAT